MKRSVVLIALALLWLFFGVMRTSFAGVAFQAAPVFPESTAAAACVACHPRVFQASRHMIEMVPGRRALPPLGGTDLNSLDCLTCHVSHPEVQPRQLRADRETVKPSSGSITFDPATRLCLSCHPLAGEFQGWGRGYLRHPVGIRVTKPGVNWSDPGFPPLVDVKGTREVSDDVIGCTTCHKFHDSSNSFLLRWRSRTDLASACLKCHPEVVPPASGTLARPHGLSLQP
jgi:predicted CXXCH cytochrome family protein